MTYSSQTTQPPSVRPVRHSLLGQARRLLERYIVGGRLEPDKVTHLLASPTYAQLPRRPGKALVSHLYLLRQTIGTLNLVERRPRRALKLLALSVMRAEGAEPGSDFTAPVRDYPNDPFEGALYTFGARLAAEVGNPQTAAGFRLRRSALEAVCLYRTQLEPPFTKRERRDGEDAKKVSKHAHMLP